VPIARRLSQGSCVVLRPLTMKRPKTPHAPSQASSPLHHPQPDAAGIDIGATEIWVAVPADRSPEPIRRFGAFTQDLEAIVQHLQHLQGALDQMNLKLHYVLDDLTGLTGQAILEAILSGERDPRALAKRRHFRVKASEEVLVKALQGDWRPEQLFVLRLAWEN